MPSDDRNGNGGAATGSGRSFSHGGSRHHRDRGIIEVSQVIHPVWPMVHGSMRRGWRINQSHDMCFIFDAVKPCKEFNGDMPFDPTQDYPELGPENAHTVTDDDHDPGLMPFAPVAYQ